MIYVFTKKRGFPLFKLYTLYHKMGKNSRVVNIMKSSIMVYVGGCMRKKEQDKSNFFKNVKRTWKYLRVCKGNLVGYAVVSITEGIIGAILPILSAQIILNITSGFMEQLIYSALAVFAMQMTCNVIFYFKAFFYRKIHSRTVNQLQIAVASELLKLEIEEIDKASSGLFIDRLNKDTTEISAIFMEYTYWISYVISNVGVLFAILFLNRYMFVFSLISATIIFLINKKKLNKQYKMQKELRTLQENKTGLTSELVRGIRDIKVLNATSAILKQTEDRIMEATSQEIKVLNNRNKYRYWEGNIRDISDLLFLILGCYLFRHQLLTIPVFVIIYNYQGRIQNLLAGVGQILEYNKKFALAANRVYEIIYDEKFKKEKFGNKHIDKVHGDFEFQHVIFGYDKNRNILKDTSFKVNANETVAFVGKSGGGKTTIFNLLNRLYTVDGGHIYIDGIDINELDQDTIRNNMSIITQNPYIFNFSIRDNLKMVKSDVTEEEIIEACKIARLHDFIMELPEKYDTIVGESGVILSGGQRQRLAIARALIKKTEIILFDEATSALDNQTQKEIQEAIHHMKGEYTILIIAHRLSTVMDSDRILVVDDGKIIAEGTHGELMKQSDFYRELYQNELS